MKKQILFLTFFVAAILVGTSTAFGQTAEPSTIPPDSLIGCSDYPLHPKAGIEYAYAVDTTGNHADNETLNYFWWATKNPVFVDTTAAAPIPLNPDTLMKYNIAGGELINASANYGVSSSTDSVQITWSAEILAATQYQSSAASWQTASYSNKTPTFVAVLAAGSCTNNLQVFEINPLPSFTVDIASFDPTKTVAEAYGDTLSQCADIVRSAVYNNTTFTLDMDYGADTMYFEVISANFVDKWLPRFQVMGGLSDDQTFDLGWAYSIDDAKAGNFISSFSDQAYNAPQLVSTDSVETAESNTASGVSIYVRVIVYNNTYPSLVEQTLQLAVDGQDASGQWDLVNSTCTDPTDADQDDVAYHTVTPRPNIHDLDPDNATYDDESATPGAPNQQIIKNDTQQR